MIRIKSKYHNFRRCGMAHPKGPVEYPDDRFSEEELSILQAEPTLTVEIIETGNPETGNSEPETGIVESEKGVEGVVREPKTGGKKRIK